jgi:hypothetical protein
MNSLIHDYRSEKFSSTNSAAINIYNNENNNNNNMGGEEGNPTSSKSVHGKRYSNV